MSDSPYNQRRLFILSIIALLATSFSFSLRSSIAGDLNLIFREISTVNSASMVGAVLGITFLGYAGTLFLMSPFLDTIGMKALMVLSSVFLITGTLTVCFVHQLSTFLDTYWIIWTGMLIIGIGWGLIDTVVNPMIFALFPKKKTQKLNALHAWWPAGVVVSGLLSLGLSQLEVSWQIILSLACLPALAFGIIALKSEFPLSERKSSGISMGEMFGELWRRPMFWVFFSIAFLATTTELAPGQWFDMALSRTIGMRGIWLLIYVSVLMFFMRHFSGLILHRFSPIGLLWTSSFFAALGLYALSFAYSPATAFLAVTVWGAGVCYVWPTLLSTASDRFPKGGTLLLGLMGTAGSLANKFFLPLMGDIFDHSKIEAAGGAEAFAKIEEESQQMNQVLSIASQESFRIITWLPAILFFIFSIIWLYDKRKSAQLK